VKLTKNMKSDFDEFLKKEGIYKEVNDIAIKKVIDYQIKSTKQNDLLQFVEVIENNEADMILEEIKADRSTKDFPV